MKKKEIKSLATAVSASYRAQRTSTVTTLSPTDSEKQHQNLPVKIYCDGSAVPNPGTMGIGLVYGDLEHVYSACLGGGTNQIAELFALFAAITLADLNDFIFTDSRYAVKVVRCEWRAHCYQDLISEIRNALEFKRIRLQWIRGHAGHLLQ